MLNVFLYLNKEEKWKQTTGQDEDENMKIIETYGTVSYTHLTLPTN